MNRVGYVRGVFYVRGVASAVSDFVFGSYVLNGKPKTKSDTPPPPLRLSLTPLRQRLGPVTVSACELKEIHELGSKLFYKAGIGPGYASATADDYPR